MSKLSEVEKMSATVEIFRSSSADLAQGGRKLKVLTDPAKTDAATSLDSGPPPAKRQRFAPDLADDLLVSSDDETTLPKPSTAASAPDAAAAAPASAAAAAPPAAAADDDHRDADNIYLLKIVQMYHPLGVLARIATIDLDWMESNHIAALRSIRYEKEQRALEINNNLPINPDRLWHGPYQP
jgi:hypothetical protein